MRDGYGPGRKGRDEELDLENFYREDADQVTPARATASVDIIQDFYHSASGQAGGAGAGPRLPDALLAAPLWHQAEAAEELQAQNAIAAESQPTDHAPSAQLNAAGATPLDSEIEEAPLAPLSAEPTKLSANPLVRFAAIGGFLGIVFGAILIGLTWLFSKPEGPYDLGAQTASAVGLKGHLYTKWDDNKAQYRIVIEPSDIDFKNAFAQTVSSPPQPLSIGMQLRDAKGFLLCSREIALKYDVAKAAVQGASAGSQPVQGKDIFQIQTGPDGAIASITAQGQIPCSEDAYSEIATWTFSPNFPSLVEQTAQIKQQAGKQAATQSSTPARKRAPQTSTSKPLVFSIQGDDVLVGYDSATGTLERNSGQEFYTDKDAGSLANWQTFPIRVHYVCDQSSYCTLTDANSGAMLRVRMRR